MPKHLITPGRIAIGYAGLGGRGVGELHTLLAMPELDFPAVCDVYEDRAIKGADIVELSGRSRPAIYSDYREMVKRDDIDAVGIMTSWQTHVEIAVAAMRAGKEAFMEVGCASSVEECWELVRIHEQNGTSACLIENCCYGEDELALLNMVKQGIFGTLIHCEAGYEHDLRAEIATGYERRHYRLDNFIHRNGELYPTHGLGPMCKLLDINRGNRMVSLVSMASRAEGLGEWIKKNHPADHVLQNKHIAQGDIVKTLIKCAHGQTITLTHDCTLPRPYSRAGRVQGTGGLWMEDGANIYIEGRSPNHQWEKWDGYRAEYAHPLWKQYRTAGIRGGHGGMDYLVLSAFVDAVRGGHPPPIDVYDTAAWMSITALSEQSAAMGGAPVPVPDFTNGLWIAREPFHRGVYCLEEVCEEYFNA